MTATSQLRKLPITALAAALLVISATKSATAGDIKPMSPIAEGWINSGANAGGRWSIARPEMLGARNRGTEAAWATYLAFELPSLPTSPGKPALQLTLVKPLKSPQNLALYGVEGKTWSPETLTGLEAPGWDSSIFDVDASKAILLAETAAASGAAKLRFENTPEFQSFLKTHAGKKVTFIIVASEGSSSFHSSEGNPELGPHLLFE